MVPREKILTLCQFPDLLIEFSENRRIERLYFGLEKPENDQNDFILIQFEVVPCENFLDALNDFEIDDVMCMNHAQTFENPDFRCRPNIWENMTGQL